MQACMIEQIEMGWRVAASLRLENQENEAKRRYHLWVICGRSQSGQVRKYTDGREATEA